MKITGRNSRGITFTLYGNCKDGFSNNLPNGILWAVPDRWSGQLEIDGEHFLNKKFTEFKVGECAIFYQKIPSCSYVGNYLSDVHVTTSGEFVAKFKVPGSVRILTLTIDSIES